MVGTLTDRAYCLRRLLEHGPMTWPELTRCTGWAVDELRLLLEQLLRQGVVRKAPGDRAGNPAFVTVDGVRS
jgi:hypothetical protein